MVSPQLKAGKTSQRSADPGVDSSVDPGVDSVAFREAMARFPSGVTIVTSYDESGRPHGFTASSFCSVSAQPPLVLVCLAKSARSHPVFAHNDGFAVSILRADHMDLARRFANSNVDKFACDGFVRTPRGAIVLEDALAVVECSVAHRYDAGDHTIMVGEVEQVLLTDLRRPAIYFNRAFRTICSLSCAHPD